MQTGFQAEEHCWKCFKENKDLSFLDGKAVNLCKGCLYVVKQFSQWLNAYGLGIRQIIPLVLDDPEIMPQPPGENGQERVVKGKKGAVEAETIS